jgi:hypothetical protein
MRFTLKLMSILAKKQCQLTGVRGQRKEAHRSNVFCCAGWKRLFAHFPALIIFLAKIARPNCKAAEPFKN